MSFLKEFEHLRIQLEPIKLATNNFGDSNCIGRGGFGKVYKGELHFEGQYLVAVKRLDPAYGQGQPEFWNEISMLTRYRHENIVSLLGFCDESGENILVYEYLSNKSLDLYLSTTDLSWKRRLLICIGVACGIEHLHNPRETKHRVLHRDIKSSNILLDENWTAKISDFGLSKLGPANQDISYLFSRAAGTPGYCDPLHMETGFLAKESDIYSFGVVLYEVLCGKSSVRNYDDMRFPILAQKCFKEKKLDTIINDGIRKQISTACLDKFSAIAFRCLQSDHKERPLMAEIVEELEDALEYQVKYEFEKEKKMKSPLVLDSNSYNYGERKDVGQGSNSKEKPYKAAVDAEKGKQGREDNMVEIHKNKTETNLLKRQQLPQWSQRLSNGAPIQASMFDLERRPSVVAGVYSNNINMQQEATNQFCELLSVEPSPPTEEVIQSGVVPRFVEFLTREDFPQLQFDAAWALAKIASGTSQNIKVVIDHGAVPIFVKVLASKRRRVRELACWALGYVAGDSVRCRDLVLGQGALMPLLSQLNEHANLSMLRAATWTLVQFCRGKPQPPFGKTRPALQALERLVHSNDEKVLTDACWALFYLSDGTNGRIQAVIDAGVCQRLVELLLHPSPLVLIPALQTVGIIVTGDDAQTQHIIEHGALPCLLSLLTHNHERSIKVVACGTITNITAGNRTQIQAVFEAGLIAPLVNLLQTAEFDIKSVAACAIYNAIINGTNEQIKYLVSQGCIKPLCDLLVCTDLENVTASLQGLANILEVGEEEKEEEKNAGNTGDVNLYAKLIDDAKGLL